MWIEHNICSVPTFTQTRKFEYLSPSSPENSVSNTFLMIKMCMTNVYIYFLVSFGFGLWAVNLWSMWSFTSVLSEPSLMGCATSSTDVAQHNQGTASYSTIMLWKAYFSWQGCGHLEQKVSEQLCPGSFAWWFCLVWFSLLSPVNSGCPGNSVQIKVESYRDMSIWSLSPI